MKRPAVVSLLAAIIISACSVPTDQSAEMISVEDLPENLRPGFTTTTTSPPVVNTEPVTYYLVDQVNTVVVPVLREVRPTISLAGVLGQLFDDFRTEEERDLGWANQLLEFDLLSVTRDGDLAVINITQDDPETDVGAFLLEAVAQLVWTATENRNVTRVRLLIDSERQVLPTSAENTEENQTVSRDNYSSFNPDLLVTEEPVS